MDINVLSLFDGLSCGQIALDNLGIGVDKYFASEIETKAIEVTQKNYPNTVQLGDVKGVYGANLPQIDLLIGGSPCTNLSFLGNQKGLISEDLDGYLQLKAEGHDFGSSQSYLFWEYVRLLNETKPKYFLLENVKMKKEWQDVITKNLGVQPIEINSSLLTAHTRKRLYWTNIPGITQPEDKGIQLQSILDSGYTEKPKSYCLTATYGNACVQNYFIKSERQHKFKEPIKRVKNTFYLNDGEVIEIVPKMGANWNRENLNRLKPYVEMLTPEECEKLQGVPVGYTGHVTKGHRYKMLGNGWTVPVIEHIFQNMEF
jgi:site-specific DNA-cytosine methylase